jgi:excisionase family DNA binding protein
VVAPARRLPAKGAPRRQPIEPPLRLALTVPEAAAALGVSERHLRGMLPELPHVHLGGRVVVPIDLLREWLRERAQAERAEADGLAAEILGSLEIPLTNSR